MLKKNYFNTNWIGCRNAINELVDKNANKDALEPDKLPKLEGYLIPENNNKPPLITPIHEQDKDAGKQVTPVVEIDKNEGIYAGSEIDIGDWRDNALTAKGKELTENANELGYKQRISPLKSTI